MVSIFASAVVNATSKTYGCNVFPTPTPIMIAYPICFPSPEFSSRVDIKPRPMAQQTQPNKMHSRYLPTQWTIKPDSVLLNVCITVIGSNMAPALVAE